jgi:hypothetical protein
MAKLLSRLGAPAKRAQRLRQHPEVVVVIGLERDRALRGL